MLTSQQQQCLEEEKAEFFLTNNRPMTPDDVPFARSFRGGAVEMDEPPGLMERYYQLWLSLGGTVDAPRVVTCDDL